MKALCWMGTGKVETLNVADPTLLNPHDAILKVTRTAICGSDLHLFDGFIPTMESGDILGHEFMGIIEEVGNEVTNVQRGDRVVVPFTIACGSCEFCKKKLWSACDNTNPNAHLDGGCLRILRLWAVRLLTYDGRICGRTSSIRARSVCECWSVED